MEQGNLFKEPNERRIFNSVLTKKQREIKKYLEANPGSFLRAHRSPSGVLMYRLLDKDINPIKNYRRTTVHKLEQYGHIQATGAGMSTMFVLKKK